MLSTPPGGVLEGLTAFKQILQVFKSAFAMAWNAQAKPIDQRLRRVVSASSVNVVGAYKAAIEWDEREKPAMTDKATNLTYLKHTIGERLKLALQCIESSEVC